MEQLSGQDASFVYMETPRTPMHIGSVAIYDPSTAPGGKVRFKEVLAFIESRLGCARAFRQKLVRVPFDLDHPYWIEDGDFDLEYHVRHIALPEPGDWRQLCIQAARLHARPLDMTKPLWEFWIIEGLNNIEGIPKGSWAVLSKVHHAAIDGMSGVEMSNALHDLTPDSPPRAAKGDWAPEKEPGLGELLVRTQINNWKQPLRVAETMFKTVPGIAKLTQQVRGGEVSMSNTRLAPKTRFNGQVTPYRVFDGVVFPLADVRAIKNSIEGATVNDAILAIIGGGLRKYLLGKDELPDKSMSVMAPISVRAESEKAALGNLVSAMVVRVGTDIEDPMERLEYIHGEAANSKAMTRAVGARTLTDMSQLMPAALAGISARLYSRISSANAMAPVFNCVATNVPGAPVPIYLAGARLVRQYGLGPILDSMGLINTIYSYCGDIAISFTSDRTMMPDPAAYAAALQESFEELKAAAANPRPRPKAKAKPAAKAKAKAKPAAKAKTKTKPAAKPGRRKAG